MLKVVLLLALAAVALSQPLEHSEADLEEWEIFKIAHVKTYKSSEEESKRKEIFLNRLKWIREHNEKHAKGEVTYTVGMNEMGDLTREEIVSMRNGYKRPETRKGQEFDLDVLESSLPATVDWRKKGAVTPIKNQGSCGSCWAFSTTGSVEGQHYLSTKKLVSLSEQNLMDCSTSEGNEGCDGGLMDDAFEYIIKNKGIDTEKSYPYQGEDESCRYKSKNKGATISSYVDVTSGSESALQKAVAKIGPTSVAMDASLDSFNFYTSGIYSSPDCSSTDLDHGVLAIGYGTLKSKKYWLVKNSWGTSWGIKGYFMLARDDNNMCGIATEASYPVV